MAYMWNIGPRRLSGSLRGTSESVSQVTQTNMSENRRNKIKIYNLGMGYVILLWHSLSISYNDFLMIFLILMAFMLYHYLPQLLKSRQSNDYRRRKTAAVEK